MEPGLSSSILRRAAQDHAGSSSSLATASEEFLAGGVVGDRKRKRDGRGAEGRADGTAAGSVTLAGGIADDVKATKKAAKKAARKEKKHARKEKKRAKKKARREKKKQKKEKKRAKKNARRKARASSSDSSSSDSSSADSDADSELSNTGELDGRPSAVAPLEKPTASARRMDWMANPFAGRQIATTGRTTGRSIAEKEAADTAAADSKRKQQQAAELPVGLYIPRQAKAKEQQEQEQQQQQQQLMQRKSNTASAGSDETKKAKLLAMAAKWKANKQNTVSTTAPSSSLSSSSSTSSFWKPGSAPSSDHASSAAAPAFWKPDAAPVPAAVVATQVAAPPISQAQPATAPAVAPSAVAPSAVAPAVPSQSDKNHAAAAALRAKILGGFPPGLGPRPSTSSATAFSARRFRPDAPIERADLRAGSRRGTRDRAHDRDADLMQQRFTGLRDLRREAPAENMDAVYARNILKQGKRFSIATSSRSGRDEEEQVDASLYTSKESRMTGRRRQELEHQRGRQADRRAQDAASRDKYNMRNPTFAKQRMVALGEHCYLLLPPPHERISWGHCMIVPVDSVNSLTQCEEDVFAEVRAFQQALEQMCARGLPDDDEHEPLGLVYLETCPTVSRPHHAVVHAVPVSLEVHEDLPIYFKKALSEMGDEFATVHSRVVETTQQKSIRQGIPPNFAYFHVEWAGGRYPRGGMARVIEDPRSFPRNFGQDVVRGLLGQSPAAFGRRSRAGQGYAGRGRAGGEALSRTQVTEFVQAFSPFDFTRKQ